MGGDGGVADRVGSRRALLLGASAPARSGADPATVAAAFEAVRDLLREDAPAGA